MPDVNQRDVDKITEHEQIELEYRRNVDLLAFAQKWYSDGIALYKIYQRQMGTRPQES